MLRVLWKSLRREHHVRHNILMWMFFLGLVYGSLTQNVLAPFSYNPCTLLHMLNKTNQVGYTNIYKQKLNYLSFLENMYATTACLKDRV
jgi:hypothetical protein